MRRVLRVGLLALACVSLPSIGIAQPASKPRSQPQPLNLEPSREVLEQSANEGCDDSSIVVQRCAPKSPAANNANRNAKAGGPSASSTSSNRDELAKSRERTKAAFDRRDRRGRQDALDNKPATDTSASDAQQLQRVTVTGSATAAPAPAVEEVLQKALNPDQTVLPNGNTMTYGPDGDRRECQANCVGPMCCKTMRARPNPALESNSIGR